MAAPQSPALPGPAFLAQIPAEGWEGLAGPPRPRMLPQPSTALLNDCRPCTCSHMPTHMHTHTCSHAATAQQALHPQPGRRCPCSTRPARDGAGGLHCPEASRPRPWRLGRREGRLLGGPADREALEAVADRSSLTSPSVISIGSSLENMCRTVVTSSDSGRGGASDVMTGQAEGKLCPPPRHGHPDPSC